MHPFEFYSPTDVKSALALLESQNQKVRLVAGATDVWVSMRSGKYSPDALISIRKIQTLKELRREGGCWLIGAGVTHGQIEDSEDIAKDLPALALACSVVGSRQVRNVGTIGGNLCNAAPSADSAVPLLIYDAECVIQRAGGTRTVPVADFFIGPGKTILAADEMLTGIRVPIPKGVSFSGYTKLTRRKAVELPILGVGAMVTLDEDGTTIACARVALGVAGPTPVRAYAAEESLVGKALTSDSVARAADIASQEAKVRDSWRGREWYRRRMIKVLIPRVLEEAGAFGAG